MVLSSAGVDLMCDLDMIGTQLQLMTLISDISFCPAMTYVLIILTQILKLFFSCNSLFLNSITSPLRKSHVTLLHLVIEPSLEAFV
jgi:hypothetical protein